MTIGGLRSDCYDSAWLSAYWWSMTWPGNGIQWWWSGPIDDSDETSGSLMIVKYSKSIDGNIVEYYSLTDNPLTSDPVLVFYSSLWWETILLADVSMKSLLMMTRHWRIDDDDTLIPSEMKRSVMKIMSGEMTAVINQSVSVLMTSYSSNNV